MEYNSGSNRASNFKSAERVARGRFEITSPITPELYDTKSYYQLIVPTAWRSFFQKIIFLIKIHVRQYLNKMGEFLKVMELKYSLSRQL